MKLSDGKKEIELIECKTFYSRFKGFMFEKNIDKALLFDKCNSIHTFFMFQKIDVIMTDKNNKIIKMYPSLKPWRIILPQKDIYYTYELPLETCKNYKINDILNVKETD